MLAGTDPVTLSPAFTFHGFRYADIATDAEILNVSAVAISSDLAGRGSFSSSHETLNQFESNVRWSQRDNFVGVPTDCPQRDERLGWTGDAQAFAATADVLFDSHQFWLNWFRDLSLDQTDDGVSSVVPDVVLDGEPRAGRAGWADAATVAPWAAYESYGSTAALEQQIDSMVRWVATLSSKRHADGLLGGEFQFGDWLDPDAPAAEPWKAKTDGDFLANAFFAHSRAAHRPRRGRARTVGRRLRPRCARRRGGRAHLGPLARSRTQHADRLRGGHRVGDRTRR